MHVDCRGRRFCLEVTLDFVCFFKMLHAILFSMHIIAQYLFSSNRQQHVNKLLGFFFLLGSGSETVEGIKTCSTISFLFISALIRKRKKIDETEKYYFDPIF